MSLIAKKVVIFLVLTVLVVAGANPSYGQAALQQTPGALASAQPPMKNVFMNVLWGSLCGGFVLMGWSTLDDSVDSDERFSFSRMTEQFLIGATYGGILGMGAGVYFSIRGIRFDANRSRIAFHNDFSGDPAARRFFATSQASQNRDAVNLVSLNFKF